VQKVAKEREALQSGDNHDVVKENDKGVREVSTSMYETTSMDKEKNREEKRGEKATAATTSRFVARRPRQAHQHPDDLLQSLHLPLESVRFVLLLRQRRPKKSRLKRRCTGSDGGCGSSSYRHGSRDGERKRKRRNEGGRRRCG
jgi:hypothetical protein